MIRGLIFDFDGVFIDTESAGYEVFREIYRRHGVELDLRKWVLCIGTDHGQFNPYTHLAHLTGQAIDRSVLEAEFRRTLLARAEHLPALPGIVELVSAARDRGLRLAVASSSAHDWVDRLLACLGLLESFDAVVCRDDVSAVKPSPELFLTAAGRIGVNPREAVVFEDSYNGVLAAHRAGIFCVAVPSPLTRHMDFSLADMKLDSLGVEPDGLLGQIAPRHRTRFHRPPQPLP